MDRRKFLEKTLITTAGTLLASQGFSKSTPNKNFPLVVSTWAPNVKANEAAWNVLVNNGNALDAVETGVKIPEADPTDTSVGFGGLPDRDGRVTLDACIMDHLGNTGSVMCLENIMHPISVARLVMEKTPHVVIVGKGALQFALQNGFSKQNLLTPSSEKIWKEWMVKSKYDPMDTLYNMKGNEQLKEKGGQGNHDTIGMIAMDVNGNLSGACSTSGMAFKMHGRVGDSPIIGAGLFVDNEVGAATATGVGEEVIRICGSHTIVEAMRYGKSPLQACKIGVERMYKLRKNAIADKQIGFIAVSKEGEISAFALKKGFTYCYKRGDGKDVVLDAAYLID